jgi:hypothetical protein
MIFLGKNLYNAIEITMLVAVRVEHDQRRPAALLCIGDWPSPSEQCIHSKPHII